MDRLYVFYDERYFFSIDPVAGDRIDYPLPEVGDFDFYPVSMAAFGEMPERSAQLLPIIAETPGHNGTFWTTDLTFFNPSILFHHPIHITLSIFGF